MPRLQLLRAEDSLIKCWYHDFKQLPTNVCEGKTTESIHVFLTRFVFFRVGPEHISDLMGL